MDLVDLPETDLHMLASNAMKRSNRSGADVDVLEQLRQSPRVTVRRDGAHDPEGRCVLYWMQRAPRAAQPPRAPAPRRPPAGACRREMRGAPAARFMARHGRRGAAPGGDGAVPRGFVDGPLRPL